MKHRFSKGQSSEIYLLGAVMLWSLFPIVTILAYTNLTPLFTAALSSLLAAVFFAIWLTYKGSWGEIRNKEAWKDILWATLIIGIVFYTLVFIGLSYTSAGDASIIAQMEVFFTMLILSTLKKEKPGKKQVLGAILMVLGATLILFKSSLQVNIGNLMILSATLLPAMGNYFQKKARALVSSASIMFWRNTISGLCLLFLAFLFETWPGTLALEKSWGFLLINGFFMFGLSKVLWIESIHRGSVIKSSILGAMAPAFTLIFAFLILHQDPTLKQLTGFLPILIGIILLTDFRKPREAIDRMPLQ